MTNYVGFINSMLELRNQRLKESMFRARQQQEEMENIQNSIGSAVGSMNKSLMAGALDRRENAMLNRVDPPAATAVDPAMQSRYTGGGGSPYTGGMDEFKLRLALQDQRNQNMGAGLAQDRFTEEKLRDTRDYNRQVGRDIVSDTFKTQDDIRADELARAAQNNMDADNARQKALNATKGLKEDFNDMESYHASMKVHENDMRDAPDQYSYDRAARSAHSLWTAAQKRGLDVGTGPPDIAPFLTQTQKADIKAQQIKVSEAQADVYDAQREPLGMIDSINKSRGETSPYFRNDAIKQAEDRLQMEQGILGSMQKGGTPFDPNAAAPAAPQGGGGSAPEGTEVTNSQGQTLIKRGGKWVLKQ